MALHRTAVCNVWNRKGNVFRGMYNLGCAKNTPRASSCKKCDWLHLKTCSCENIQSGWCENTGSNLHIFTDFEQDLLFLLEVKVVDWRMYYGNDKALWGNWLIKYSGVCVCVYLLRVCLVSSFCGLVQLQVQFDPNFTSGDLVQQEAPIRRTFTLHLFLYGCHGNLGATQEIWKKKAEKCHLVKLALLKTFFWTPKPVFSSIRRASRPLTVWRELVLLEHGDAQHVLVEVLDEELAVEVPLGVEGVADGAGGVALRPHRQLTVRVAFTWTERQCASVKGRPEIKRRPQRRGGARPHRWVCRLWAPELRSRSPADGRYRWSSGNELGKHTGGALY